MAAPRRMALVVQSDLPDRLEEAAAFAASGTAAGMAVRALFLGPALGAAAGGHLPEAARARLLDAREAGDLALYACSAAYARLGLAPEQVLAPSAPLRFDAVVGIPTFLAQLEGADIQLLF